jgi:hypothetical protein
MTTLEKLKNGHKTITLNTNLIEEKPYEYFSKEYREGTKSITFTYNEPELIGLLKEMRLTYSMGHFHRSVQFDNNSDKIYVKQTKTVKLRKKPNSDDITAKSLEDWNNLELTLTKDKFIVILQEFIDNVNKEETERLAKEIARIFGKTGAYAVGSLKTEQLETELAELKEQQKKLEEKIMEVKSAILEEKKQLAINFIEVTQEINPAFKDGLIQKIQQEKPIKDTIVNFSL